MINQIRCDSKLFRLIEPHLAFVKFLNILSYYIVAYLKKKCHICLHKLCLFLFGVIFSLFQHKARGSQN